MRVNTPEKKEERKQNAKRKHVNAPSEAEAKKMKSKTTFFQESSDDEDEEEEEEEEESEVSKRIFLGEFQGKSTTPRIEFPKSSDDDEEEEEEDEDEEEEGEEEEEEEEEEDEEDDDEDDKEEESKMKLEISKRTFLGEFPQIKFPETSELANARFGDEKNQSASLEKYTSFDDDDDEDEDKEEDEDL